MRTPAVNRCHGYKPEVGESPAEIEGEEEIHQRENVPPEKIYVAVGKDMVESVHTIRWALQNLANIRSAAVILLHIRASLRYFPSPMGRIPVNQVSKDMVAEYKKKEQKEIDKCMKKHLEICSRFKVKAEPLVIEKADVSKGIVEVVSELEIGKLIMGTTSAGGSISKKIKGLGKADYVQKHALESCEVSIVCKGTLVLVSGGSPLSPSRSVLKSKISRSSISGWMKTRETPRVTPSSTPNLLVESESDETDSPQFDIDEPYGNSTPINALEGSEEMNTDFQTLKLQLREALQDAEESKRELQMETEKRKKAEAAAITANKKFKDCEAELQTMGEALRSLKAKVNEIWRQRHEKIQELEAAHTKLAALEAENCRILQEKDNVMKELNGYLESRARIDTATSASANIEFREYNFDDIVAATCNFAENLKIGQGGYGMVYKGEINETTVAIKILKEDSSQGRQEFQREIDIVRNFRHPHVVNIVGVCFERGCLIYEYMSNGSLRDRLFCKNATLPLPWHARFRIAAEICSALQFLHTSKPNSIVHRDLKPENILLDENFVSKISDFGLARPIREDYTESEPKGTIAYMDPEYLTTLEFTPKSDVYSFGVVVLQLLTGKPALGLVGLVKTARKNGQLKKSLDPTAGEWPLVQATQLAELALQCTEQNRNNRPDLHPTLMKLLDSLRIFAVEASNPSARPVKSVKPDENAPVPRSFLCPIIKEYIRNGGYKGMARQRA